MRTMLTDWSKKSVPIYRWYFKTTFSEWKCENSTNICSLVYIDSDNDRVPKQAVILTNDGLVRWHIYTSLRFDQPDPNMFFCVKKGP